MGLAARNDGEVVKVWLPLLRPAHLSLAFAMRSTLDMLRPQRAPRVTYRRLALLTTKSTNAWMS